MVKFKWGPQKQQKTLAFVVERVFGEKEGRCVKQRNLVINFEPKAYALTQ